ncbi:MAG: Ig-like domain-containing protein [Bacteroidales bacterium]|nr:Ig-like domain-containing protein [Bacteroidales bacterium]
MNRCKPYLFFIFCCLGSLAFAQTINHKHQILILQGDGLAKDTVQVGGLLDASNTTTKGFQSFVRKFEPLKKISITNNSTKPLISPRIVVNNINFFDEQKMLDGILASSNSLIDTLFAIYTFVKNNIVGRFAPSQDAYDKYKAIFVYGYASCSGFARNMWWMLQALDIPTEQILQTHHHTVQALVNGRFLLFDGHEQVFYKKLCNNAIAGLDDIINDKFLIRRTRHLSGTIYDYDRDLFTSLIYDVPNTDGRKWRPPYSFDFVLRPGEKLIFDYSEPSLMHQLNDRLGWGFSYLEDVKYIISNSIHLYRQNFLNVNLSYVLNDTLNLTIKTQEGRPNFHPRNGNTQGKFVIMFDLPFPVLDINIVAHLYQASTNDSIFIYYSIDSINWMRVHTSQQTGQFVDSVNLHDKVAPLEKDALYRYFLKFLFHPKDSAWASGIDSLVVKTTFQCSRFFLPKFRLGKNTIKYTDANGNDPYRNAEVTIKWQESWENTPPNRPAAPVFPLHQANVDSLFFAFKWEVATDDDGDEIVDYEFMLSQDSRMLFPLSPNFNRRISTFGEDSIRPYFKVEETGWLNHGETYYWRVRAKDARGAWSEWSDTWSFTPHGVMRPVNGKAEIVGQSIKLSWERNPIGNQPDYFVIYASNETSGFSPSEQTFFAFTDSTSFIIPFDKDVAPFSFFRITARDTFGQESLISDVIAIPYPFMYAAFDSVRPGLSFCMNLFSNTRFFPYYHFGHRSVLYVPAITVVQKPDWLNYNSTAGILYSTDTTIAYWLVYQDSSQRTIVLSLDDGLGGTATQTIFLQTAEVIYIRVTNISLDKDSILLDIGESEILTAIIIPDSATNKTVTWMSDNPYVATVNETGKVTGIAEGVATITATTEDGSKTAVCNVTVQQKSNIQISYVSSIARTFPNPTDGIFTLQFETSGTYFVTITDITGRVLLQQSVSAQTTQIDISPFSAGLYFLNINDGRQVHILRILKY